MRKIWSFYSISLFALSSCLPSSNFKGSDQGIVECDPNVETCPGTPPTFSFNTLSVSPANSFNPTFSAKLSGNLNLVSKVILYTQRSGSTCSAPITYDDGRNPLDGIAIDDFNGNQLSAKLNLISLPANTDLKIYGQVVKTDGTLTSCAYLTFYKHNLQSPITLASAVVDGAEVTSVPSYFKNPSLTLKLAASIAEINQIKLYKNSCATTSIVDATKADFTQGKVVDETHITLNQLNKFYAKGFNNTSAVTGCLQVFSSTHDDTPPSNIATISHSAVSRSLTSTPAMTWSLSTDSGSGLKRYDYAIGTQANLNDIRAWSAASSPNNFVAGQGGHGGNLSLSVSVGTYFFKVRAVDDVGNFSAVKTTSWRVIDDDTELSISFPPEQTPLYMISQQQINVTGECISGIDVTLGSSTGVTGPAEVTCSAQNTFNYPVVLALPGTGSNAVNRTIIIKQDNGLSEDSVSRTVQLSPLITTGSTVAASHTHSCTIINARTYCFGANATGQLGSGDQDPLTRPHAISENGQTFSFDQVTTGIEHSCTLRANKVASCWGSNTQKQVGQSTGTYFTTPQIIGGPASFLQISAGGYHTCAILWNKDVYCWGDNAHRQLGDGVGDTTDRAGTVKIDLPDKATHISAGGYFTCALLENKDIYCWGKASNGELGFNIEPLPNVSAQPKQVHNPLNGGEYYIDVSAGSRHACATTNNGRAFCWGRNDSGALGYGSVEAENIKIPTSLKRVTGNHFFKRVFAGGNPGNVAAQVSCGITNNDALYCWGYNADGQLGVGDTTRHSSPVAVDLPADEKAIDVAIGSYHTCARTRNTGTTTTNAISTFCWGQQASGKLGNGQAAAANKTTPIKVSGYTE